MDPATLVLIMTLPTGAEVPRIVSGYPTTAACVQVGEAMKSQLQWRYECRKQGPTARSSPIG